MRPRRAKSMTFWSAVMLLCCRASVASGDAKASMARVDQEIRISICSGAVEIEYDTSLNRPAAFLEVVRMDSNKDGQLSPAEQQRYFSALGDTLAEGLELTVNGRPIRLEPAGPAELSPPLTKTYRFTVPHPDSWTGGDETEIELHNDNYLALPGTVKILLDPGEAADITFQRLRDTALGDSGLLDLSEAQERDIIFRYRQGSGQHAPHAKRRESPRTDAPAPPGSDRRHWILAIFGVSALLAIGLVGPIKRPGATCLILIGLGIALCSICVDNAPTAPGRDEARDIFLNLHEGVYKAFNGRTEDEIYDALAECLEGEILDKVYNEVRQAVAKRTSRQTSFRVRRIRAISTEIIPEPGPGFKVRHHWRVYGTVRHMAHSHTRFNEYQATYTVNHNGKNWRITDSQIRRHRRVSIGQS